MKINYLLSILLLFSTISCSDPSDPKVLDYSLLYQKDGIHYRKKTFGEEVYSGSFIITGSPFKNRPLQKIGTGYIQNGKFHGDHHTFDYEGELIKKETYNNGELEKLVEYVYGKPLIEGSYKNGEKEGVWIKYSTSSPNGIIEFETYKNGKLDGLRRTYYEIPHGLKTESIYPNGIWKSYHPLMNYHPPGYEPDLYGEGYLKDGEMDGVFKYYTTNGNLRKEVSYKEGYKHGVTKVYRSTLGSIEWLETWEDGIREGLFETYNNHGNVTNRFWIHSYTKKYPGYGRTELKERHLKTKKEYLDFIKGGD